MGRGLGKQTIGLVDRATEILREIQPASVRAVCYRLFTIGAIRSMAKTETNKVSRALTTAREMGLMPWSWLVDETREAERVPSWDSPEDYADAVVQSYRRNRWTTQPERIEVWSEKGTIRGTLAPVLRQYAVTFRVFHGYASATSLYDVAVESREALQPLTAFYVGDWDPSGLHMSEVDIPRRLREYGGDVDLIRVALTEADVADPALPSFVAATKARDPRYAWYLGRSLADDVVAGRSLDHLANRVDHLRCWEVDALSPVILRERVAEAIRTRLDLEAWGMADIAEAAEHESLVAVLKRWPTTISRRASEYGS